MRRDVRRCSSSAPSTSSTCSALRRAQIGLAFLPVDVVMGTLSVRYSEPLITRFGAARCCRRHVADAAALALFAFAPVGGELRDRRAAGDGAARHRRRARLPGPDDGGDAGVEPHEPASRPDSSTRRRRSAARSASRCWPRCRRAHPARLRARRQPGGGADRRLPPRLLVAAALMASPPSSRGRCWDAADRRRRGARDRRIMVDHASTPRRGGCRNRPVVGVFHRRHGPELSRPGRRRTGSTHGHQPDCLGNPRADRRAARRRIRSAVVPRRRRDLREPRVPRDLGGPGAVHEPLAPAAP